MAAIRHVLGKTTWFRRGQRPRLQNFFKFFARNLKLNRLGFDRTNGARRS